VKAIEEPHLFQVILVGLGTGLLLWWLAPRAGETEDSPHQRAIRAMVVVAAFMVAYKLLAGFGVGVALIAAWVGFGLCALGLGSHGSSGSNGSNAKAAMSFVSVLTLGSVLLLYRLFSTRYTLELRGVELDDHYALFGLVLGAALPAMVAGFQLRGGSAAHWNLLRLAASGILLLSAPAIATMIWGSKFALAMIFGLALSTVFGSQVVQSNNSGRTRRLDAGLLSSLFALAVGLALTQWMKHALPLASMARSGKVHLLGWTIGAFVVIVVLAGYAGKFAADRNAAADGGSQG
jgi:hypothetical protein